MAVSRSSWIANPSCLDGKQVEFPKKGGHVDMFQCEAPKKTHFTLKNNAQVFCTFLLKLESIAWAADDGVSGLHCVWQLLRLFFSHFCHALGWNMFKLTEKHGKNMIQQLLAHAGMAGCNSSAAHFVYCGHWTVRWTHGFVFQGDEARKGRAKSFRFTRFSWKLAKWRSERTKAFPWFFQQIRVVFENHRRDWVPVGFIMRTQMPHHQLEN